MKKTIILKKDYWYSILCKIPADLRLLESELQEYHFNPRIIPIGPIIKCIVFDWDRKKFEEIINQYEKGVL